MRRFESCRGHNLAGGENEIVGDTWRNEYFSADAVDVLRQVDNAKELTERLRGREYPNLSLESVVFQGEYHLTMMPAAVTRGLLVLFDKTGFYELQTKL